MFTIKLRNAIMNTFAGLTSDITPPVPVWAGLSTTMPNMDGTGVTEPTAAEYARVLITPANLTPAVDGVVTNAQRELFPKCVTSWGTVLSLCWFNAATGGDLMGFSGNTDPQQTVPNMTLSIEPGTLELIEMGLQW